MAQTFHYFEIMDEKSNRIVATGELAEPIEVVKTSDVTSGYYTVNKFALPRGLSPNRHALNMKLVQRKHGKTHFVGRVAALGAVRKGTRTITVL